MKVEILDNSAFSSLAPDQIGAYLRAHGWKLSETIGKENNIEVWDSGRQKDSFRLQLPLTSKFKDFPESMGRVVRIVAEAQKKSQLEILEDFATVAVGDVVRITGHDRMSPGSTTISLADGVHLFESAKKMATAAALAAENTKPVFPTYRSPTVLHYLDSVRLGQTEAGSYRIKFISPISVQRELFPDESTPFGRTAMKSLMSGLRALDHVSGRLIRRGYRFEEFNELVDEGVSANLCESLLNPKPNDFPTPVSVDVTWSTAIRAPQSGTDEVFFKPDQLAFIRFAAKDFRERNPEYVELVGQVVGLQREKVRSSDIPKITIATLIDGRIRKVHVEIQSMEEYDVAGNAHMNYWPIAIHGELSRQGRFLWLREPQGLKILNDFDLD